MRGAVSRRRGLALALLGGVLWAPASAAPITFNTALPVAGGEFVFRQQLIFEQSGDDPAAADRDRGRWSAVSTLGYGLTGDAALFATLPYLETRLEQTSYGARRARSARGLGDVSLLARITLFKDNQPGRTFRLAPFAGLKAPTGDNDETDSFGTLPPGVQSGSGSWDGTAGVVATYQTLDYQMDVQAAYTFNTRADGFQAGNVARLDASLQVRLWPPTLGDGVPGFLYGVLEANLVHRGRNRVGGRSDPNSGGVQVFAVPGIQYVTRRWIVEAAVQVPVVQNLGGTALESGYVARAGFRVNF